MRASRLSRLLPLLLLLIATAGCDQPQPPAPGEPVVRNAAASCNPGPSPSVPPLTPFPRTLTDALGNKLTIPSPPQRIISQTLGTDEILFAICPSSRIVGVSTLARNEDYSNILPQAKASTAEPSMGAEQVLRLKPDLIFVASYSRAEIIEMLRASHAPIFRFANFDRIEDMKTNIRIVGRAIGEDEAAERLVADMDRRLGALQERMPEGQARPKMMTYSGDGYTAGANTLFDDVIRAAGGINISSVHVCGFGRVSGEQVLQWNPDVIVTGFKAGQEQVVREALLRNAAVAATRAGKEGRIIMIPERLFVAASQHVVDAAEMVSEKLWATPGR
jgi:iron complex transport system substrate-binding protein